jgi:hypothetical protein
MAAATAAGRLAGAPDGGSIAVQDVYMPCRKSLAEHPSLSGTSRATV